MKNKVKHIDTTVSDSSLNSGLNVFKLAESIKEKSKIINQNLTVNK